MAAYRKVPIVPLEMPRLRLRPHTMADEPRIQALLPIPNVVRYLHAAIPWPYPDDGARQHLQRILPRIERMEEYDTVLHCAPVLRRETEGCLEAGRDLFVGHPSIFHPRFGYVESSSGGRRWSG